MIHEDTYKQFDFNGTKGLIFFGDKILVYRRDTNTKSDPLCIDLPGGGREGNESPFDTFKRETKEEFGINLERDDIIFSCPLQSFTVPTKKSFFMVTKPLEIDISQIVFGNEGVEWMLMSLPEFVMRTDGIKRQQKRVEDYLNGKMVPE